MRLDKSAYAKGMFMTVDSPGASSTPSQDVVTRSAPPEQSAEARFAAALTAFHENIERARVHLEKIRAGMKRP
jgi:hypothetical protein